MVGVGSAPTSTDRATPMLPLGNLVVLPVQVSVKQQVNSFSRLHNLSVDVSHSQKSGFTTAALFLAKRQSMCIVDHQIDNSL